MHQQAHDAPLPKQQPNVFNIELHGRRYTARWAQLGTVEQLRVNLRVEAEHDGKARVHVETLDLYSTRSRSVFASRVAKLCDASADLVEEELAEIFPRPMRRPLLKLRRPP